MKENCLEFNNLKQPNKTKVHSLNSIFCVTANHRFAWCQNMCNSKPTSQVLYLHTTLYEKIWFLINLLA